MSASSPAILPSQNQTGDTEQSGRWQGRTVSDFLKYNISLGCDKSSNRHRSAIWEIQKAPPMPDVPNDFVPGRTSETIGGGKKYLHCINNRVRSARLVLDPMLRNPSLRLVVRGWEPAWRILYHVSVKSQSTDVVR